MISSAAYSVYESQYVNNRINIMIVKIDLPL